MNDGISTSVEARLAVLEDNMRRVDTRLGIVIDRTHALVSSMQAVSLGMEEAHDQRLEVIARVSDIQRTIGTLTADAIKATAEIGHHVTDCVRRGARTEKIQLSVLVAILTLAVALLTPLLIHH